MHRLDRLRLSYVMDNRIVYCVVPQSWNCYMLTVHYGCQPYLCNREATIIIYTFLFFLTNFLHLWTKTFEAYPHSVALQQIEVALSEFKKCLLDEKNILSNFRNSALFWRNFLLIKIVWNTSDSSIFVGWSLNICIKLDRGQISNKENCCKPWGRSDNVAVSLIVLSNCYRYNKWHQ